MVPTVNQCLAATESWSALPTKPITSHTPLEIQLHRIDKFLAFVFNPGDLVELLGLGQPSGKTMRMLTRDYDKAARVAIQMSKRGADVYYCLNPVDPRRYYAKDCLRDFKDVCQIDAYRTAKDADISERNTYLIDCDSIREKGTPSTPEHRAAALALATTVQAFLAKRGWPEPIILDSGNGVHLLYKGDRSGTKGSLWDVALRYLSKTLSTEGAKVDVAVFNPARISRLPYILNKKAGRDASVISYPAIFKPVAYNLIYGLALEGDASAGSRATRYLTRPGLAPDFDPQELIDEFPEVLHGDGVTEKDGAIYYSLSECPFKGDGEAHRGQGVGVGKTAIILWPDGIGFRCFSDHEEPHSFVDLLRLLYERTGRRYSGEIWATDLEELAKRFPFTWEDDGNPVWLDDPTQLTRNTTPTSTVEEYIEDDEAAEESPEETVIKVSCPTLVELFRYATREADSSVARINPAAQADYRREVERIIRARDYRRMAEALGQHMIDAIDPEVLTSATPPAFVDSNGDLSVIALDVLMHTDDIPLNMNVYTLDQFLASAPPTS